MILKSLRLRGFKGVRAGMGVDEIFIDLATLPEGLIAITGPNGMGKTTVMDNLTPFRLMPFKIRKSPVWSPGAFSFYDQTFGPDACKELVFEMGGIDYRSLILIDADRRRQECYLYRSESDQWVPVNDGKSRTYDEAIEKVCGSPQLFFTSVYRCQSARNLSDYTRSDIMGIISELLNIDHIRLQGDKCRAVVAGLSAGLDLTRDRMVALSVEVEAVDGLSVSIADKISVLDVERTNLVVARASLDVTRSTVATLREQQAAQESEAARLLLLKTQLSDEEKRLADGLVAAEKAAADIDHRIALVVTERDRVAADLQTRIDRATRIVSGAEAIRKAVADEAQTQAALAGYKSRLPDIQTTRDVAFAHSTDIGQRIVGTCSTRDAALADLRTRIARSNGIMADAVGIRQAVEQEANAVAILDNERGRLQSVQATRDARFQCVATQQMNLVRVKARLDAAKNDSDKLVGLDCRHDESGWLNPTCRFISEAVAGREALPELIAEHAALVEDCTANIALADADLALQDCRARIAAAEAELVACQPLARMLPELDLAVANLDTWNQEVADITARVGLELTNLYAEQALAQAALADADLALKECRRWVEVGETGLVEYQKFTRLLPELELAEANLVMWEQELVDLRKRVEVDLFALGCDKSQAVEGWATVRFGLDNRILALRSDVDAFPVSVDLDEQLRTLTIREATSQAAVGGFEKWIRDVELELASLRTKLEAAQAKTVEVAELQAKEGRLTAEVAKFSLLMRACSTSGIIALELDDASPSIAAIVNDLLRACYGSRFSVRLDTQAEKVNGDLKETFDIVIFDSETGDERSITECSGGQVTVLEDAITRGICLYNIHRSDRVYGTLYSDEKDGALDEARKLEFMRVKREALRVGTHRHEFFITQTQDLSDMADARIVLAPGGVVIQ